MIRKRKINWNLKKKVLSGRKVSTKCGCFFSAFSSLFLLANYLRICYTMVATGIYSQCPTAKNRTIFEAGACVKA